MCLAGLRSLGPCGLGATAALGCVQIVVEAPKLMPPLVFY